MYQARDLSIALGRVPLGLAGLWKDMIPSSCSLPPQVWSDRSRLQCNNAIHSSTVGALRSQLSPRFSKNIPSASAGHFCLQSLHHFATADAATCSAVATVLKGFASLITRPGFRKMAIPFPLQCTAVRALVLCFGFVSNSGRPGFFDGHSKAVCNGCLRTM